MILVSACLLGEACKYNGSSNESAAVKAYLADKAYLALCPEALAGLPVPRTPCERCGEQVLDQDGVDKTAAFQRGAAFTLALCEGKGVTKAILKEQSPSCGVHRIYDGSFSGRQIAGCGLTTELLLANGIEVCSEEDL